jgi:hypothetical protein
LRRQFFAGGSRADQPIAKKRGQAPLSIHNGACPFFFASVETIAIGALRSFQPPDDAKVEHQKAVYDLAISRELGDAMARKLAIEACGREWWATKKSSRSS